MVTALDAGEQPFRPQALMLALFFKTTGAAGAL
jgi:hypothetical protein